EIGRFGKIAGLVEMDQIRTERCNGGSFEGSTMAVATIGLMKHRQRLHHVLGKKLPPIHEQHRRIFYIIGHLSDCAASRSDIAVVTVEDEDLAKSNPQKIAQDVCVIHRHYFRSNRDRPLKMCRVRRTLRELDYGKQKSTRP